jgi:DNA invertase Pin-like site-specific DNA recombinase
MTMELGLQGRPRLTRSLADFAKLVELFDAHGVSFVSVTQQFNTTTSMGRLTLNVLLSFAQFEREVTSERIRDKIGASKRKGLWVGGVVPLGYQAKDRKITVVADEAKTVRHIFRRYLDLGSLNRLLADLRRTGVKTKLRPLSNGRTIGGIPFTRGSLSCATASILVRSATRARSSRASNPPSSIAHCLRPCKLNWTSRGAITPRRGKSPSHS